MNPDIEFITSSQFEEISNNTVAQFSSDLYDKAIFSKDYKYRYGLYRVLNKRLVEDGAFSLARTCIFIMLNPSTADAFKNDPTVTRCVGYAKKWNYDALAVLNLFGLRSTDPKQLYESDDPVGNLNDLFIKYWVKGDPILYFKPDVICAWGNHGSLNNRGQEVLKILKQYNIKSKYLKLTKSNQPAHPLYLKKDLIPKEFNNELSTV